MKRNKEGKARQRVICTGHLDKQGQRDLDEWARDKGIRYADITKVSPLISAGSAFRRLGKKMAKALQPLIRLFQEGSGSDES